MLKDFVQRIKNDHNVVRSLDCQLCEATFGVTTSTTTLRRHLLSIHSSAYTSNNQQQRQITPYTPAEQQHITVKLAKWIVVDLQPFSIVEQVEFQLELRIFDPKFGYPIRPDPKFRIGLTI